MLQACISQAYISYRHASLAGTYLSQTHIALTVIENWFGRFSILAKEALARVSEWATPGAPYAALIGLSLGVVLATANQDTTWTKSFGAVSIEEGAADMKDDTLMWVASCTKLMTTVAVMQCVEKGLFYGL
jgi:CubicO group peptidase (beta-lactamase class C family)